MSRYCRKDLGLPLRPAARKPLLSTSHRKENLSQRNTFSGRQRKQMMWSDESIYRVSGTQYAKMRRTKGSHRYDPKYSQHSKHPHSAMVWGSFSYHGVCSLVFLDKGESMNSDRYLELLCDNLEACYKCKAEYFMQDGARCLTACKQGIECCDKCDLDYIKDWPANSADLNACSRKRVVFYQTRGQDRGC